MIRSLVTGGAGFIGSNLVDSLLKEGHEVVCVDNESASNEKFFWNEKAINIRADVTDYKWMKNAMSGVDYVFHLAAESRLQPAIKNPIEAVVKNCVGTTTVLQCARETGVKKFMYSSTSSGYGMNSYPNVETQPDDCLNPYSASKVAAEKFCKMYTDLYGLKTVVFRYFNVYGERSPVFGQYAPVIGIFLKQKNEGKSLTIVGDGSQRRDFIHVKDVAAANILAATTDIPDEYYGQVFNIGSSNSISIQEIADLISDDQVYIPKREGEMETTFANIDKAKEILGWTPKIDVSDWIRENL